MLETCQILTKQTSSPAHSAFTFLKARPRSSGALHALPAQLVTLRSSISPSAGSAANSSSEATSVSALAGASGTGRAMDVCYMGAELSTRGCE